MPCNGFLQFTDTLTPVLQVRLEWNLVDIAAKCGKLLFFLSMEIKVNLSSHHDVLLTDQINK